MKNTPAAWARIVAEGVEAKLAFDFACQRGDSFGEHHVHGAINELICALADRADCWVRSGYAAPEIQSPNRKGRPREIDFGVIEKTSRALMFALEAKWAGSSHCKAENVLTDFARLQAIANSTDAVCVFLLAGHRTEVGKLWDTQALKELIHSPDLKISDASGARRKRSSLPAEVITAVEIPSLTQLVSTRRKPSSSAKFTTASWVVSPVSAAR